MELAVQPIAFVGGAVGVPGGSLAFRHEALQIDVSNVLASVFVLDPHWTGRILVEIGSEALGWIDVVIDR